ncbi:hypothetical protein BAE44_0008206 [Dichanthelium oligosanthes]|uniref:Mediator of RNA polymerase II transcription subunit 28 n=1 Tax=Dichanthelium oligosanthes TaxID=888268 RepID=A0A1E5W0A0_9POAL|nr:hypothetical protein BAE44_0008206 [Dichanthelium oligosanthes]
MVVSFYLSRKSEVADPNSLWSLSAMAEPPPSQSPAQTPPPPPPHQQLQAPAAGGREDMLACVAALEAALLPCLPARELQAVDRSLQSSHQIDVERHARDFMEAAKKLQSYFISLQREDQPTAEEMLRKVHSLHPRMIESGVKMCISCPMGYWKGIGCGMPKTNHLKLALSLGIANLKESPIATCYRQFVTFREITTMEEELKTKSELIAKHKKQIEGWRKELKEQLGKHVTELERV